MQKAHGLSEFASIFDLMKEAHLAFAVGCKLAALALSRAVLERVLRRNYECNERELGDVIVLAERKYPQIAHLHLDDLRRKANDVLHEKSRSAEVDDKDIERFFERIRTLIQNAPKK